jgi:hypothetical protein
VAWVYFPAQRSFICSLRFHSAAWVQLSSYMKEKVAAPVCKTKNTAVGNRHADHVAPSILKIWLELCRQAAVTRSVEFACGLRPWIYLCNPYKRRENQSRDSKIEMNTNTDRRNWNIFGSNSCYSWTADGMHLYLGSIFSDIVSRTAATRNTREWRYRSSPYL